ncbi:MAG TPA: SpoIVB peptidase S55 domain-containing protein [Thermoanaerobaculia bacterium]
MKLHLLVLLFTAALPASLALAKDATQVPPPPAGGPAMPSPIAPPPTPIPVQPPALPSPLPTISVDEVRAGQKGYGLSVFSGSEPERFDVEVIGVMRNLRPEQSYILARLTGHDLERSGVSAGMSGSPVFLDGKLAGAVAFSWPFSHDAIAGITPIDSMRGLSAAAGMAPVGPPPPPVELAALTSGHLPKDLLEKELKRLQPPLLEGAQSAVSWATSGFGELSQGFLHRALGSSMPSGRAAPSPPGAAKDIAMGGAVAAVLVDGDLQLAAVGTVTDRYGDQVLAFGHPFLGLGTVKVPMAKAEVVTVLSSQYSSFKISNIGDVVGAFEQDRQVGIQGRLGQTAPMIPLSLRITGVGTKPRDFKMRVAEVPQFTPMLLGSALLGGLESTSYSAGAQGIDLQARFKLKDRGDLEVRQSFDGDNAGTEAATFILAVAGYLTNNPFEKVGFDSVSIELAQSPQPRSATLVGANAERTVVYPGERVGLNLDLVAWRGERFRRTLTVDLPQDLPAGRYSLVVGDGASIDATRLSLEPAAPVSLTQALRLLRSLHSRRDLIVLGIYAGPGLSVAGEVMPRLPGSVRSLWNAAASGSAAPLRTTIAQQVRREMDVPVDGLVKVDLEVRRREPVGAEGVVTEKAEGKGGR